MHPDHVSASAGGYPRHRARGCIVVRHERPCREPSARSKRQLIGALPVSGVVSAAGKGGQLRHRRVARRPGQRDPPRGRTAGAGRHRCPGRNASEGDYD